MYLHSSQLHCTIFSLIEPPGFLSNRMPSINSTESHKSLQLRIPYLCNIYFFGANINQIFFSFQIRTPSPAPSRQPATKPAMPQPAATALRRSRRSVQFTSCWAFALKAKKMPGRDRKAPRGKKREAKQQRRRGPKGKRPGGRGGTSKRKIGVVSVAGGPSEAAGDL